MMKFVRESGGDECPNAFQRMLNRGLGNVTLASIRATMRKCYTLVGQRYVVYRVGRHWMVLDTLDPGLSRGLILFRTREIDTQMALERYIRPGMRIYDIGGNIGYYPLLELDNLRGSGQLVVLEPVPSNVSLLKANLALNGYHTTPVLEMACSNYTGRRKFYLSQQSNLGTFHPRGSAFITMTGESIEVETVTIPVLARRFGPPDLIRMDIEGHEVEVIDGMLPEIASGAYAPVIVFETHFDRYDAGHDMSEVLDRLFGLDYSVQLVSTTSDTVAHRLIQCGYNPGPRVATDAVHRTLFYDIRPNDAMEIICHSGGTRTVVLGRARAKYI